MEIIENALADGVGAKDSAIEAELDQDSDAVASVFYREQQRIGQILSNAEGRPSKLYRFLQLIVMAAGVRYTLTNAANNVRFAKLDEATDLLYVSALLAGASFTSFLLPLESTRVALMPGGILEQLNVGKQRLSNAAARRLERWRVFMCVLAGMVFMLGLLISTLVTATRWRQPIMMLDKLVVGLVWLGPAPVLAAGWWPSMFTASCLCR